MYCFTRWILFRGPIFLIPANQGSSRHLHITGDMMFASNKAYRRSGKMKISISLRVKAELYFSRVFLSTVNSLIQIYLTFFCCHQKKVTKKTHRCMKFIKNLQNSLNCGNSSLRSSNNPQFLKLILRFSLHEFHEAESISSALLDITTSSNLHIFKSSHQHIVTSAHCQCFPGCKGTKKTPGGPPRAFFTNT